MKSGSRLKIQAVSLLLAVTAVLTAGCAKADEPTPDKVDSDKKTEEAMIPLTAENLDAEAEKLANEFAEKGFDTNADSVRRVLLHLNKDSFTEDEYYALFDASKYADDPINSFFKEVGFHNDDMVFYNQLDKLINLKDFCRSTDGYKVIGQLESYSLFITVFTAGSNRG